MRFYDASTRTDLPVPFEIVTAVVHELRSHADRVVVVGAVARDLLASGAGNLTISRATHDVDVAIAVSSMAAYADLGALTARSSPPHFEFLGHPVDVIPFGALETHRTVLFENDMQLDVTGIAEAADHAVDVRLPGGGVVPVASLASQSVLKVLAWRDRGLSNTKDAIDLQLILSAASSGIYSDELWDETELLDMYEYDMPLIGAHRLGCEAARLLGLEARMSVESALAGVDDRNRLGRQMSGLLSHHLLRAYWAGFRSTGTEPLRAP